MRSKFLLFILAVCLSLAACTENQRAKNFGGNMNIQIPPGQKLVTATWKDDHLWYMYRPIHEGEQPETSILKEDSSWGIVNGSVTFHESK